MIRSLFMSLLLLVVCSSFGFAAFACLYLVNIQVPVFVVVLVAIPGVVCLVVWIRMVASERARNKAWVDLIDHIRIVEAEITGVALDDSITVDGIVPYCVHARWLDPMTMKTHEFESGHFWLDPTAYLKSGKVSVCLLGSRVQHYHMELAFIPGYGDLGPH